MSRNMKKAERKSILNLKYFSHRSDRPGYLIGKYVGATTPNRKIVHERIAKGDKPYSRRPLAAVFVEAAGEDVLLYILF